MSSTPLWQAFTKVPRYSFIFSSDRSSICKVQDSCGLWIEHHDASKLIDAANDKIQEQAQEIEYLKRQINKISNPIVG